MRKYRMCVFPGVLVLFVFFSIALAQLAVQSGSAQTQKAAPPDLSGFWLIHPSAGASAYSSFAFAKETPPMTAWGEEKYKAAKPVFGPNKTTAKLSNDAIVLKHHDHFIRQLHNFHRLGMKIDSRKTGGETGVHRIVG